MTEKRDPIHWSDLDWSPNSPEKTEQVLLDLITHEIKQCFSDKEFSISPDEFWLRSRFAGFARERGISPEDTAALCRIAIWHPAAWDIADEICQKMLTEEDHTARKPLSYSLGMYALLRMRGEWPRPSLPKGKGNNRNANLMRNYFISESLECLYKVGFKKEPAIQLIASAFNNAGLYMITEETVRHVKRNHEKYLGEIAKSKLAEDDRVRSYKESQMGLFEYLCENWAEDT